MDKKTQAQIKDEMQVLIKMGGSRYQGGGVVEHKRAILVYTQPSLLRGRYC